MKLEILLIVLHGYLSSKHHHEHVAEVHDVMRDRHSTVEMAAVVEENFASGPFSDLPKELKLFKLFH